MYFNSILFLLYFLPIILVLFCIVQYFFPYKYFRLILLFGISVVFYWWSAGIAIIVLFGIALWCYFIGWLMLKYPRKRRITLIIGITFLVAILAYYKYNPSILSFPRLSMLLQQYVIFGLM